jgi:hypothetical protein
MGGSSPSSGESTHWQSLAEPRFSAGRSRRRRPQSNTDGSGPGLVLVGKRLSKSRSNRVVSQRGWGPVCRMIVSRRSEPVGA